MRFAAIRCVCPIETKWLRQRVPSTTLELRGIDFSGPALFKRRAGSRQFLGYFYFVAPPNEVAWQDLQMPKPLPID